MSVDANGGSDVAADFHLVEAHGTWRLTIKGGERLMAALADDGELANGATFTVHVEPNLLPSGVFDAAVEVQHVSATTRGSKTPERSTR